MEIFKKIRKLFGGEVSGESQDLNNFTADGQGYILDLSHMTIDGADGSGFGDDIRKNRASGEGSSGDPYGFGGCGYPFCDAAHDSDAYGDSGDSGGDGGGDGGGGDGGC